MKQLPADGTALLFTPAFPMVIFPHSYKELALRHPDRFSCRSRPRISARWRSRSGRAGPDDVKSVKDFVAWAKKNPDKASFGAPTGGAQHFTGLMLARDADIKLQLISYRGGAPSVTDALGGHVPAIITPLAEVLPQGPRGQAAHPRHHRAATLAAGAGRADLLRAGL